MSPKLRFISISIFISITLISLLGIWLIRMAPLRQTTFTPMKEITKSQPQLAPSATPTPTPRIFEELTIPYLRNRTYESSFSELTVNQRLPLYTSYLTSYTSDGLKIQTLLTIPTSPEPVGGYPAIVFIHGYIPPKSYRTTTNYQRYVDALARQGFVVAKIDLRGHGTSEGEATGAYYSSDYVIDTLHAYTAVKNLPMVNQQKIGLWGHSMAGNIVVRTLATAPHIPVAVIWAGAVYTYEDMLRLGIQDASYQPPPNTSERQKKREQLFATYGEPGIPNEFWKDVIPVNFLQDYTGAIQLHHAANDDVVDIEYSKNVYKILKSYSVTIELQEYDKGGHNIEDPFFTPAMDDTVRFFQKHL